MVLAHQSHRYATVTCVAIKLGPSDGCWAKGHTAASRRPHMTGGFLQSVSLLIPVLNGKCIALPQLPASEPVASLYAL